MSSDIRSIPDPESWSKSYGREVAEEICHSFLGLKQV